LWAQGDNQNTNAALCTALGGLKNTQSVEVGTCLPPLVLRLGPTSALKNESVVSRVGSFIPGSFGIKRLTNKQRIHRKRELPGKENVTTQNAMVLTAWKMTINYYSQQPPLRRITQRTPRRKCYYKGDISKTPASLKSLNDQEPDIKKKGIKIVGNFCLKVLG